MNNKRYRIIELEEYNGYKSYKIQKKSWLGFWYNPLSIDGCQTGVYNILEEAEEMINRLVFCPKTEIIKTIEG